MTYPGDGYKMSNYGFKNYTPDQVREQWKEAVVRERKVSWGGGGGGRERGGGDSTVVTSFTAHHHDMVRCSKCQAILNTIYVTRMSSFSLSVDRPVPSFGGGSVGCMESAGVLML
jgi:hypothetical protein